MPKATTDTYIYGRHVLEEALARAPDAVRHVYIVKGSRHESLSALLTEKKIPFERCAEGHLPGDIREHAVHQGIVALVAAGKLTKPYKPWIESLVVTPDTSLVVLGELTDPQNVGSIIRSAAAFGAAAVLLPEHRQAQITGTVVKVSAGMAFTVPLISIGNVNTVLRDLKERGFWIYGLAMEGTNPIDREVFDAPAVFVVGGEGEGLRAKTEETCDIALSIPMDPRCESLNAATSLAVTLYAWSASRRGGRRGVA